MGNRFIGLTREEAQALADQTLEEGLTMSQRMEDPAIETAAICGVISDLIDLIPEVERPQAQWTIRR